ncbi:glycosyltransferase family 2 protein [Hyphobacterium sp.]|uniref:glycosyltransferase family 2 protein n=1 Tax=Hyphobacterium sp. TaxID=2004662 RepID=UPI003749EF91
MKRPQCDNLTISLVTPNFGGEAFLVDCLDSIASQHYPALDHVVVDGGSTDTSMAMIEARRARLSHVICEPDNGHADALNKGFAQTSGEIMGWLNSDDMLHPGCLETVDWIFRTHPDVAWITGQPSSMNERGEVCYVGNARPWSRLRFLSGDHLWIQQESTFWRRSLWEAAGGRIDTDYQVANDFELWARFFRYCDLHTVDRMLGCFRIRNGQRSVVQARKYEAEVDDILKRELLSLKPDYRESRADILPSSPMRQAIHKDPIKEDRLSVDDPPMIDLTALRHRSESSRIPVVRPLPASDDIVDVAAITSLTETITRNWRFFLIAGFAAAAALIIGIYIEDFRIWLALLFGIGLCLSGSIAIAIKTRRIVNALDRRLAAELVSRAKSEIFRQELELELDRLARMGINGSPRSASRSR